MGLIQIQTNQPRLAEANYKQALYIAKEIKHVRLLLRAQKKLNELLSGYEGLSLNFQLIQLLDGKFYEEALSTYVKINKQFVKHKVNREKHMLHVLLPAIFASNKKQNRALWVFGLIEDDALKLQAIKLLHKYAPESFKQVNTLQQQIEQRLGVKKIEYDLTKNKKIIFGVDINKIEEDDLKIFAELLCENEKVSKEMVCTKVWNFSYDPVIHDNKIYKLINRFRSYIGHKDVIINKYGYYTLNIKEKAG